MRQAAFPSLIDRRPGEPVPFFEGATLVQLDSEGTPMHYLTPRGKTADGEDRPSSIPMQLDDYDETWATYRCALPTDDDLEGLTDEDRKLRSNAATCAHAHTDDDPCIASDGIVLWVSVPDDNWDLTFIGGPLLGDRIATIPGGRDRTPFPPRRALDARPTFTAGRAASERLMGVCARAAVTTTHALLGGGRHGTSTWRCSRSCSRVTCVFANSSNV